MTLFFTPCCERGLTLIQKASTESKYVQITGYMLRINLFVAGSCRTPRSYRYFWSPFRAEKAISRSYHQLPKHIWAWSHSSTSTCETGPFPCDYLWNGSFPLWLVARITRWWRPWMMPLSIAWRSDKSDGMHFGLMVWPKTTSNSSMCRENPLMTYPRLNIPNTKSTNASGLWDLFLFRDALRIVMSDVWFWSWAIYSNGLLWYYLASSPAPISKAVVAFAFPTISLWSYLKH